MLEPTLYVCQGKYVEHAQSARIEETGFLPECSAEFVIVHVGLALPLAPPPGHLVGVRELELALRTLPGDAARVVAVRQQLKEELP